MKNRPRPDEEAAAKVLQEFLGSRRMAATYDPGNEPPDLRFNVNGERWAVEVTEIEPHYHVNGKPKSRREVVKPIMDEATNGLQIPESPPIKRSNPLHFSAPISRDKVRERCAEAGNVHPGLVTVSVDSEVKGGDGVSSHCNATEQVRFALKLAWESKSKKLDPLKKGARYDRTILLLWSKFLFDLDIEDASACWKDLAKESPVIDSVFLIHDKVVDILDDRGHVFSR